MSKKSVRLTISAGHPLDTQGVILYEEGLIREAVELWNQAESKMAPAGPQFGFFGSPAFVIGAASTASLFESWRTRRLGREAAALSDAAAEKYEEALATARHFPWSEVEGVTWPEPARWQAFVYEDLRRKRFIPKLGTEICFESLEGDRVWVVWTHVARYQLCDTNCE